MASTLNLPSCKYRYALFVSYLGHRYRGSQRLVSRSETNEQETVQEALEWSLESFLRKDRCRTTASSRTDKGVHALMNVYTLPLMDYELPTEKLKQQANFNLMRKQHDVIINEVLLVPAEFHPRKEAKSREYIYRIAVHNHSRAHSYHKKVSPSDLAPLLPITELYKVMPLPCFNYEKATEAIEILSGEHDYASFAYQLQDNVDTVRHLDINLSQETSLVSELGRIHPFTYYQLHFKSRAFLYNQVRRIVGTIVDYATYGDIKLTEIEKMINKPSTLYWGSRNRIAEPWGLYLSRINYDVSSFQGSIKTFEDEDREEKVLCYPPESGELSDDQNE